MVLGVTLAPHFQIDFRSVNINLINLINLIYLVYLVYLILIDSKTNINLFPIESERDNMSEIKNNIEMNIKEDGGNYRALYPINDSFTKV